MDRVCNQVGVGREQACRGAGTGPRGPWRQTDGAAKVSPLGDQEDSH